MGNLQNLTMGQWCATVFVSRGCNRFLQNRSRHTGAFVGQCIVQGICGSVIGTPVVTGIDSAMHKVSFMGNVLEITNRTGVVIVLR